MWIDPATGKYVAAQDPLRSGERAEPGMVLEHRVRRRDQSQFGRLNPQQSNLPRFLKLGLVLRW